MDKQGTIMNVIDCGEVLDISMVRALHEQIVQAMEHEDVIQLAGSRLQRIDGAGVQLLVAAVVEAARRGCKLNWQSTSPALLQAADYLGCRDKLGA